MIGSVYPDFLCEQDDVSRALVDSQVAPSGTFLLRRAHYLSEFEQESLLSAEQQQALTNLVKGADLDAKQKVVSHNLHLVAGIARRYADRGVEFLELVREGAMGLIYALEKFELEGGFRFSAYARWCIRENIERAIMNRNNSQLGGAC